MNRWTSWPGASAMMGLSLQGRPGGGSAAQSWIVIRANHHQRKTKEGRPANAGGGFEKRPQTHIKRARLDHLREGIAPDIPHLNSDVGPMTAEFLDGFWKNVGSDQRRRAHG